MSENTDDFEIDPGKLPTPSNKVETDLDPLSGESGLREEIAPADELEEGESEQPKADDITVTTVTKFHEELESKFDE